MPGDDAKLAAYNASSKAQKELDLPRLLSRSEQFIAKDLDAKAAKTQLERAKVGQSGSGVQEEGREGS